MYKVPGGTYDTSSDVYTRRPCDTCIMFYMPKGGRRVSYKSCKSPCLRRTRNFQQSSSSSCCSCRRVVYSNSSSSSTVCGKTQMNAKPRFPSFLPRSRHTARAQAAAHITAVNLQLLLHSLQSVGQSQRRCHVLAKSLRREVGTRPVKYNPLEIFRVGKTRSGPVTRSSSRVTCRVP